MGAALLLGASGARANLDSDAIKVLEIRLAMPAPATEFARWEADQWTYAASECLFGASPPVAAAGKARLSKVKILGSGSYGLARELGKMCAALATGPAPICYELTTRQPPFSAPWPGMPSDYLYLAPGPLPVEGSMHTVGGYCYLVNGRPETRKFFAGKARMSWVARPSTQTLNTPSGARSVKMGTISFEAQGAPRANSPQTLLLP